MGAALFFGAATFSGCAASRRIIHHEGMVRRGSPQAPDTKVSENYYSELRALRVHRGELLFEVRLLNHWRF
jgi:hypothetical protein